MTLQLLAALIKAGKDPGLLAPHTHDGWIVKNRTSCPRCRADDTLLAAGRDVAQQTRAERRGP